LPDAAELAGYLAREYHYPHSPDPSGGLELVRVAQFVDLMFGHKDLVREMRRIFTGPTAPNEVHRYLAEQPGRARRRGAPNPWPLVVSANYDDLLEQAFEDAGEPYDLVSYATRGPGRQPGFLHRVGRDAGSRLAGPKYDDFALGKRTVILKMHGSVDRSKPPQDSFVVTENDYITYMSRRAASRLPSCLINVLKESHFLFLGYRLADWNLRAFLFGIWESDFETSNSWAIQRHPDALEVRYWLTHNVEIVERTLEAWVEQMLNTEPVSGGAQ
jgi:hypothetical protein